MGRTYLEGEHRTEADDDDRVPRRQHAQRLDLVLARVLRARDGDRARGGNPHGDIHGQGEYICSCPLERHVSARYNAEMRGDVPREDPSKKRALSSHRLSCPQRPRAPTPITACIRAWPADNENQRSARSSGDKKSQSPS